jgi:SdpI/YhfL family protein
MELPLANQIDAGAASATLLSAAYCPAKGKFMDSRIVLVAYVLPGLAAVFGIPMGMGLIPPNRFYGFRTRKTLSSVDIWYRANRFSGWALAIAGIAAVGHNILFQHDHANLPSAMQQVFMSVSTSVLLLLSLVFSALYVRKL